MTAAERKQLLRLAPLLPLYPLLAVAIVYCMYRAMSRGSAH